MFQLNDEQRELIEDNILLFYKCFHKLKNKYTFLSEDEIWDCCTEAAVKVAHDLDEKKGKYSTLLFVAAQRNVLKQLRYYDFDCRKGIKTNYSIDFMQGNRSGDRVNAADEKEDMLERYLGTEDNLEFIENDAIERMFSLLGKREREVMYKIIIEDITRVDIAREWGVRPQTVNAYVASAKEKIRKVYKR